MNALPRAKLLVSVDVSEAETIPELLVDLVASLDIVLLGFYPVPDQSSPEQLRDQFEARANEALQAVVDDFEDAGTDVVDTKLVFTPNPADTIDRVAADTKCDAVLTARHVEKLERILVPVRGKVNLKRIIRFVGGLVGDTTKEVTLFHVTDDPEEADEKELMIKGMQQELGEEGFDTDLIAVETFVSKNPTGEIMQAAQEYDAVVMGETEPSVAGTIFGEVHERVVENARGSVMIVRLHQ